MEFKGTKGKWEADEDHVATLDESIHGNLICVIPDYLYPESQVNWKANALLISKAPEMLEMLKNISSGQYIDNSDIKQMIKEATEL
jgi:hypothetical protein